MSQDPNTVLQSMLGMQMGGLRTPAQQYTGILDAIILDTDVTNPALSVGYCRVTIPSLRVTTAFGPAPYPGAFAPPDGTNCVVGFIAPQINAPTTANLRVLSLEGFSGGAGALTTVLADCTMPTYGTSGESNSCGVTSVLITSSFGWTGNINMSTGVSSVDAGADFGAVTFQTSELFVGTPAAACEIVVGRLDGTSYLTAIAQLDTNLSLSSPPFYQFTDFAIVTSGGTSDLALTSDLSQLTSTAGGLVLVTVGIGINFIS